MNFTAIITTVLAVNSIRYLTQLKSVNKKINSIFKIILVFLTLISFLSFYINNGTMAKIGEPLVAFTILLLLFSIIKYRRSGDLAPFFILLGFSTLITSVIVVILNNNYKFIESASGELILPIGSLLQVFLLSVSLTIRISDIRKKLILDLENNKINLQNQVEFQTKQLLDSEKFSAIGRMARGVAHEINNPLMILQGNIRKMNRILDEDSHVSSVLQKISESHDRISIIVKGFLKLAETSEIQKNAMINIEDLINDALELKKSMTRLSEIDIKYQNELNKTQKYIKGDYDNLFTVMISLINNSIDAISNLENRWIKIRTYTKENNLYIAIIDSGTIPNEEIREQMFEPFYTTKNLGQTLGLSLPLAKNIIQNHHGTIRCFEKSSHTGFMICLPKAS